MRENSPSKTLGPDTIVENKTQENPSSEMGSNPDAIEGLGPGQSTEVADGLLGRVIAKKYRLMKRVGRGGMGSVYEAVHLQTERRTALKILNQELSRDLKVVARFRREALAASRLNHENCVAVFDFGEDDDGTFYISMEFVDGVGLGTELRRLGRAMEAGRVIRIGSQILAALDAAHAAGIIHRDLKPQNVMITKMTGRSDVVKVVDFGIAKFIDHGAEAGGVALTMPGTIFGTPEYMSPEQARGEELDGRSDVYSAAVVLWHMLLGRSPFRGQNVRETLMNVFQMQPPRPSEERPEDNIPRGLEDVLLRALHKDAETRTQSPAALLSELTPFIDAMTSSTQQLPRLPTPGIIEGRAPPETLPADYLADGTRRPTSLAHGALQDAKEKSGPSMPPAAPIGPPVPSAPKPLHGPPNDEGILIKGVSSTLSDAPTKLKPRPAEASDATKASPGRRQSEPVKVVRPAATPAAPPTTASHARPPEKKSVVFLVMAVAAAFAAAVLVGGVGMVIAYRLLEPSAIPPEELPKELPRETVKKPVQESQSDAALALAAPKGFVANRRAHLAAISRAEFALSKEDLAGAAKGYRDAIRADLNSAKAHQGLAMVAFRQGDLDTAKAHFERIMVLDKNAARQIFGFHAVVKKKIRLRDEAAAKAAKNNSKHSPKRNAPQSEERFRDDSHDK